jgi:L-fucose isomerase-like protein
MSKSIGVLALARPTFDVDFATQTAAQAFETLDASGHSIAGSRELLFDTNTAAAAVSDLEAAGVSQVLILQVTFTDASMTMAIAERFAAPLSIWAFPEPRIGGRLRLNALCGLNLAAHALGLAGQPFGYLYAAPDAERVTASLVELLRGRRLAHPVAAQPPSPPRDDAHGGTIAERLRGRRIARLGEHPDGFHTCAYDAAALEALTGVSVEPLALAALFEQATEVDASDLAGVRAVAERDLAALDRVDQDQLQRSLRLKGALDKLRAHGGYSAFAIRCWPETFTEYGGAVCGPVSMLGEQRVPCACEADVHGAFSSMLLQEVADAPVFQVDLVDLDASDGTGVVWHCGQAPVSMAAPGARPTATVHTNRRMPLLYEFALKPGRVTFARLSRARGETKLVIAGGEMLERPMAFTGTSGVIAFDASVETVLDTIIGSGLEHHTTLAYGDHRDTLRDVAGALDIPVLEIA